MVNEYTFFTGNPPCDRVYRAGDIKYTLTF